MCVSVFFIFRIPLNMDISEIRNQGLQKSAKFLLIYSFFIVISVPSMTLDISIYLDFQPTKPVTDFLDFHVAL